MFFKVPDNQFDKTFYFYGNDSTAPTGWVVPQDAQFVYIMCIGGGGGGGTGSRGGSIVAGGGGGGSGGLMIGIFPALLLPDTLYIKVGRKGIGAIGLLQQSGVDGSSGTASIVSLTSDYSTSYFMVAGGGGGGLGTNVTNGVGSGGSAGGSLTSLGYIYPPAGLGSIFQARGGQTGQSSTSTGIRPSDSTDLVSENFITRGAGGGGPATGPGGNTTFITSIDAGLMTPQIYGYSVGSDGYPVYNTGFRLPGGAGSSGGNFGTSPGGRAAYGGGGGGSGNADTTFSSKQSDGGDGGDGLVIIRYW